MTGFSSSVLLSTSKNCSRGLFAVLADADVAAAAAEVSDLAAEHNVLLRTLDKSMMRYPISDAKYKKINQAIHYVENYI